MHSNGDNRETGWVNRLFTQEGYTPEYQELKFTLHRKLLDRINLEALVLPGRRARRARRSAPPSPSWWKKRRRRSAWWKRTASSRKCSTKCSAWARSSRCCTIPPSPTFWSPRRKLVYVERGGKLYRTPVEFKDNAHLLRIIEKVVSRVGRRVDESSPLVDARLPDGSRVNAAIPPVAVDGPLLSIRRFGRDALQGRRPGGEAGA